MKGYNASAVLMFFYASEAWTVGTREKKKATQLKPLINVQGCSISIRKESKKSHKI